MEYGYSIIMIAFAVLLFIYGLALSTGESRLIMRYWAAKMKNRKKYAKWVSKIIMLVSTAPLISGIVGLIVKENTAPALITLLVMFVVTIIIGIKYIKQ